jgi:hypothetical protein
LATSTFSSATGLVGVSRRDAERFRFGVPQNR